MSLNIGGSAIKPDQDVFTHGFFHRGVKSQMFRTDTEYQMRILPSFDYTIADRASPEFRNSYVPYRDESIATVEARQEYSAWYYTVVGYTFYGSGRRSLISPLTGGRIREYGQLRRGVCPINDVFNYVSGNSQWSKLTERPDKKTPAPVVKPKYFVLLNILAKDPNNQEEKEFINKIGIFSGAAFQGFEKTISFKKGKANDVDFMYGDFTDPATGLTAYVKSTPIEGNPSMSYSGISFTKNATMLDDTTPWPLDLGNTDALSNRYDVTDTDNILKYPSYDEVLEIMVEGADIPHEVIESACAPYAENGIPESKNAKTVTNIKPIEIKPSTESTTSEMSVSSVVSAINPSETKTEPNENVLSDLEDNSEEVMEADNDDSSELTTWKKLNAKYHSPSEECSIEETQEYFVLSNKLGKNPADVPAS